MKLSIKQINDLITGCTLAAELKPTDSRLRHFITVFGYELSTEDIIEKSQKLLVNKKFKVLISKSVIMKYQWNTMIMDWKFLIQSWKVTEY